MSTHEDLVNLALYGNRRDHVFVHDAVREIEEVISQLKREWAHELAERIRNEDAALGGETYQRGWSFQDAADLIDPES